MRKKKKKKKKKKNKEVEKVLREDAKGETQPVSEDALEKIRKKIKRKGNSRD